jgi:predicted component of type VI protein secretion system
VRDTIKRTIIEQEPRVELLDVRVLANEDRNLLNVTIIFRVKNDAQEDTLTVVLEGIR